MPSCPRSSPSRTRTWKSLLVHTLLVTKLPRGDRGPIYHFDDEVALKFYRLQKIAEGSIDLKAGEEQPITGPTSVGTGVARDDQIELSKLIDILNDRFGTEFRPGDQLFFDSSRNERWLIGLRQAAHANTVENSLRV